MCTGAVYGIIVDNSMATIHIVTGIFSDRGGRLKVDRLVSIILILVERKRIGAQELAEMFEVSPRTIYRDIDAINLSGVPVRATPGVNGGFEIMEDYKLDKKVFSTTDLTAILTGLTSLAGRMHGDELANALAKIRSFIPAAKAKDIELKANQIFIDLSPWMGNIHIQAHLDLVKKAMGEHRLLSFDYADRYGTRTTRRAEPYQLVLKGKHWYWQGYCRTRNDFRLFKLSRMSELHMLQETFFPRDYQNPPLDMTDSLARTHTTITIRIHKTLLDRALDYCPLDQFRPDGDEHFLVSFPFLENEYYYTILLGFGNKCECLEPLHIRAEMKRRIEEMGSMY